MKIRKIEISNFRSIKDKLTIEGENLDFTTIVGKNSTGKSNILRAVNLFFTQQIEPELLFNAKNDITQGTKAKSARIQITLQFDKIKDKAITKHIDSKYSHDFADYIIPITLLCYTNNRLQYTFVTTGNLKKTYTEFLDKILDTVNCVYIPAIKDYKSIVNKQMIKKIVGLTFQGWGRGRKGSRLIGEQKDKFKNLLESIQKMLDESGDIASDIITSVVPDIDKFSFSLPYDNLEEFLGTVLFNVKESHLIDKIQMESVGSGIQSFTIYSMLKLIHELRPKNTYRGSQFIWLIEEPETFMHHDLQRHTRNKLKEYSKEGIILISTHSPVFVDKNDFTNTFFVTKNASTNISKLNGSNLLGVLSGNLGLDIHDFLPLKRYNVLVEGETDKKLLNGLYRLIKKSDKSWTTSFEEIEFIVCGSANSIPHFYNVYNVFNHFADFYCLFDRDAAGLKARGDLKNSGISEDTLILINTSDYKTDNEIEDLVSKDIWDSALDYLDDKGLITVKQRKSQKTDYEYLNKDRVKVKMEFTNFLLDKAKDTLFGFEKYKELLNNIYNEVNKIAT